MNILSLRKVVSPKLQQGINYLANSKAGKWAFSERAGDIAAGITLASTTTKDLVNCVYYTAQSLNNEKIPEEKRKFVAAIDLSNGILNVVSQLTLGMYIKNKAPQMFDFIAKKSTLNGPTLNAARTGFSVLITLIFAQIILKRVLTPFLATPMAHHIKEYAEKKTGGKKSTESTDSNNNTTTSGNSLNVVSFSNELSPTFKSFQNMLGK